MIIMKKIYGIFLLSLFLIPLYAKEASQQIVRCKDLEIKLVVLIIVHHCYYQV